MTKDKKENNRKLSESEQRRLACYEKKSEEYVKQGYKRTELTVGIVAANIFAFLYGIPLAVIGVFMFYYVNPEGEVFSGKNSELVLFFLLMILLIVIHELIHGITWAVFTENHWKDIEFGYIKEYMTPYCACTCPLGRRPYIAGALMPLFILGLIPMGVAIAVGSGLWLLLGITMTISAGGDILIVINILKYKSKAKEVVYMDHPTKAGGTVFEK